MVHILLYSLELSRRMVSFGHFLFMDLKSVLSLMTLKDGSTCGYLNEKKKAVESH